MSKIVPNPWAVKVAQDSDVVLSAEGHTMAADFQFARNAYDAAEEQSLRNDESVRAAARKAGPGFDAFAIIRGWPYR